MTGFEPLCHRHILCISAVLFPVRVTCFLCILAASVLHGQMGVWIVCKHDCRMRCDVWGTENKLY